MARKRKSTKKRRSPRRNPARRKSTTRRRSTAMLGGLGRKIVDALKTAPFNTAGMLAAKWAAKLGNPDALETDPETWDWTTYLKGAGGAVGAGLLVGSWKPSLGQEVMKGGFSLMFYKLLENEVFPKNAWLTEQFGQDDDDWTALGETVEPEYQPGDIEMNSEGRPYLLGEDSQWYPMDEEEGRMSLGQDIYNRTEPPGALGDALEIPGPLGLGQVESAYARTLFQR